MGIVASLCDDLTIKTAPKDVLVIGRRRLRKWLRRLGQVLSPAEVAEPVRARSPILDVAAISSRAVTGAEGDLSGAANAGRIT